MTNNQRGWFKESYRHMLASKGIKTKKSVKSRRFRFGSQLPDSANVYFIQRKDRGSLSENIWLDEIREQYQLDPMTGELALYKAKSGVIGKEGGVRKFQFGIFGARIDDLSSVEQNQSLYSERDALKAKVPGSSDSKKADIISKIQKIDAVILSNIAKGNEKFNMVRKERDDLLVDKEKLRENARYKMEAGHPLNAAELDAFTEHPYPGMHMLSFKKVRDNFGNDGYIMVGGPLGGEHGMTFDEALEDSKKKSRMVSPTDMSEDQMRAALIRGTEAHLNSLVSELKRHEDDRSSIDLSDDISSIKKDIVDDEEALSKLKRSRSRKYMAYSPTFVAADLPLIAGDAVGTAGAATIGLIPLAVTAGALYYGTKAVKKGLKKTRRRKRK